MAARAPFDPNSYFGPYIDPQSTFQQYLVHKELLKNQLGAMRVGKKGLVFPDRSFGFGAYRRRRGYPSRRTYKGRSSRRYGYGGYFGRKLDQLVGTTGKNGNPGFFDKAGDFIAGGISKISGVPIDAGLDALGKGIKWALNDPDVEAPLPKYAAYNPYRINAMHYFNPFSVDAVSSLSSSYCFF